MCEWFDDSSGLYQIEVSVTNRIWGPLFGYRGSFEVAESLRRLYPQPKERAIRKQLTELDAHCCA